MYDIYDIYIFYTIPCMHMCLFDELIRRKIIDFLSHVLYCLLRVSEFTTVDCFSLPHLRWLIKQVWSRDLTWITKRQFWSPLSRRQRWVVRCRRWGATGSDQAAWCVHSAQQYNGTGLSQVRLSEFARSLSDHNRTYKSDIHAYRTTCTHVYIRHVTVNRGRKCDKSVRKGS